MEGRLSGAYFWHILAYGVFILNLPFFAHDITSLFTTCIFCFKFGHIRVHFGYVGVDFGPLGVDFLTLKVSFGPLVINLEPLEVNFDSL